ncbi:glycosyltransferase family 2 protein [Lachnospiraceae bacterium HCP28S3_F9]
MSAYSVIVPVYNSEKTLKYCIESILNQTIDDFELILVDDGSTDASGAICDDYMKKDKRIKVFHQSNKGVSAARNRGLEEAEGKWIVFVDSDDFVDSKFLEIYGNRDTDLLIVGFRRYDLNGKVKDEYIRKNQRINLTNQREIIRVLKESYVAHVWNKRFCRSIIKKNGLFFNECFNYGEDLLFIANYIKEIKNLEFINKVTYNWCENDKKSLSKVGEQEWINKYAELSKELLNIFGKNKEVQDYLLDTFWWTMELKINSICNSNMRMCDIKKMIYDIVDNSIFKLCLRENKKIHVGRMLRKCFQKNIIWGIIIKYRRFKL